VWQGPRGGKMHILKTSCFSGLNNFENIEQIKKLNKLLLL